MKKTQNKNHRDGITRLPILPGTLVLCGCTLLIFLALMLTLYHSGMVAVPEFLSGLVDNITCGAPLAAVIYNHNSRGEDYAQLKDCPRPGHADYTARVKYHGFEDHRGGGHFSGRLTAAVVAAGAILGSALYDKGIKILRVIHN